MLRIRQLYFAIVSLLLLLVFPKSVWAQVTNHAFEVTVVDTEAYPTVSLTLESKNGTPISNAPLRILANGIEQPLMRDHSEEVTVQAALFLDPRNLDATGIANQSHYAAIIAALLVSIENSTLIDDRDWLFAAAAAPNGGLHRIQDWTTIPADLVDSFLNEAGNIFLLQPQSTGDSLMYALEEFKRVDSPALQARSLIYLGVGAEDNDVFEQAAIDKLAKQATDADIQIHAVQFSTYGYIDQPNIGLETLAAQSQGRLLQVDSLTKLESLLQDIFMGRERRVVDIIAPVQAQSELIIQLTLTDGRTVEEVVQIDGVEMGAASLELTENSATGFDHSAAIDPHATTLPQEEIVREAGVEQNESALQFTINSESLQPSQAERASQTESPNNVAANTVLSLPISRNLLIAALPLMLILVALFGYQEINDRRHRRDHLQPAEQFQADDNISVHHAGVAPTEPEKIVNGLFDSESPIAASRTRDENHSYSVQYSNDFAPWPRSASTVDNEGNFHTDEVPTRAALLNTVALHNIDNDATFPLSRTVEQPTLGYLVCLSEDSELPQKLPIYQISQKPNEVRQLYIGRHRKRNTLVINSQYISREHAILIQKDGRLYVRDNASTTGTFLNWKRLASEDELLLRHKDLISFGQVVYEFQLEGEHEPTRQFSEPSTRSAPAYI